jgi:hypothetical protein
MKSLTETGGGSTGQAMWVSIYSPSKERAKPREQYAKRRRPKLGIPKPPPIDTEALAKA